MMAEFGDDLLSNCGNCFGRLWRVDGWLWKGSETPRTLLEYQVLEPLQILNLGLISLGDRPPWNSIGVPPSKLLLKGCRKDSSIAYEKRRNTWLFIGLLNPNS